MRTAGIYFLLISAIIPGGCTMNTPSMMNTAKPQVLQETKLQQVPVADINDGYIYKMADDYARYGSGSMKLSLAYDPSSKTYTAMKAFNDLARIKSDLGKNGVSQIQAETVKVDGTVPTLLISYESLSAYAPAGCRNMPGLSDGLTTREIGDYRFGCSIDTALAQQIYRPGDLYGRGTVDPADGRRAANSVEYYRTVEQEEAEGDLDRIGRTDINAQ